MQTLKSLTAGVAVAALCICCAAGPACHQVTAQTFRSLGRRQAPISGLAVPALGAWTTSGPGLTSFMPSLPTLRLPTAETPRFSPAASLALSPALPTPEAQVPAIGAPRGPASEVSSKETLDQALSGVRRTLTTLGRMKTWQGNLFDFSGARAPDGETIASMVQAAQSVAQLLAENRTQPNALKRPPDGKKLRFTGIGARDVYNPTAPFKMMVRGRATEILAARVEPRNSETSAVVFFEKSKGRWRPLEGAPQFQLQDPFFSQIGGELVFGGVETFPKDGGGLGYRTIFYRGHTLSELKPFTRGPEGMKDIRLASLPDGRLLVLTRPQGVIGGRGQIAMTVLAGLASLGPEAIAGAKVIEGLFAADEWGGANELHLLRDGRVGVLGHIARFDENGNRHYYPIAFTIDPATGQHTALKILLERAQLPPGASKRPDLEDVLFSGGLVRGRDGAAVLYLGAGDAEAYRVTIPDPFP